MNTIKFFDANISIGPGLEIITGMDCNQQRIDGKKVTVALAVEEMGKYAVEKALVSHRLSYQYSPAYGNQELLRQIEGHENLLPLWMAYPTHTGEMGTVEEVRRQLCENQIKGILLYSGAYRFRGGGNYRTGEWNCGDLYSLFEEMQMPVFARLECDYDYDELYCLLKNHPKLKMILRNAHLGSNRNLYGIVEACSNLYVETTDFKAMLGIEDFVSQFGSERLVYGSGFPMQNMGGSMTPILLSQISYEDKVNIASANLEKLIGGIIYG